MFATVDVVRFPIPSDLAQVAGNSPPLQNQTCASVQVAEWTLLIRDTWLELH